jgi:hypothetical protein
MNITEINSAFNALVNGNETTAGTNHEVRQSVWQNLVEAHGQILNIEINGHKFSLELNSSLSGKSHSYVTFVSKEEYALLNGGSTFGLSKRKAYPATLSIQEGQIILSGGKSYSTTIHNAAVTVL